MTQAVATVAVTEAWANSKHLADVLSIYFHFQQQTRIEIGNAAPATLPYVGKRIAGLIV